MTNLHNLSNKNRLFSKKSAATDTEEEENYN